jgi:hypothetical protein
LNQAAYLLFPDIHFEKMRKSICVNKGSQTDQKKVFFSSPNCSGQVMLVLFRPIPSKGRRPMSQRGQAIVDVGMEARQRD